MGAIAGAAAEALFGRVRQRVLAWLFTRPEESFYLRELVRAAGTGVGAVQREVARLAGAGLLVVERRGRQVHYRANAAHPVFAELRGLVTKTAGLAVPLRAALAPLGERLVAAFVYGSLVRGEERAGSDVDLFCVGDISLEDLVRTLRPAQEALDREVTPVVYRAVELAGKVRAGHAFVTRVLAGPKLFVVGGERELAGVVGQRVAGGPRAGSGGRGGPPARGRAGSARRGRHRRQP